MIFDRAINRVRNESGPQTQKELLLTDPMGWRHPGLEGLGSSSAMKIAAVSACIEIRSDSIAKMPFFVMDNRTREKKVDHYLNYLLTVRPNPRMTPYTLKKLLEVDRLSSGNAYILVVRSGKSGVPIELMHMDPKFVTPVMHENGDLYYRYRDQRRKIERFLHQDEVIHLKGYSEDGIIGQSVLSRASEVLTAARSQQQYEGSFYENNARPSGVLITETELKKESKDKVRDEWTRLYGGSDNAFKVAVLDHGLEYKPIGMSQRDAQFVESKELTVADIARFFLVPLYKLQAGKQSYESNEQNAIEYVVTAIHPTVTQWEEEWSYKLLFSGELRKQIEIRINMNAELRGDTSSRARWYRGMRDVGAYSVNDIRGFEDLPDVDGGELRIAPLNSIPLQKMDEYFDHLMGGGTGGSGTPQPVGGDK